MYDALKTNLLWALLTALPASLFAQDIESRLAKAYAAFEADPQLRTAMASLHVEDAKTGNVLFSRNATTGLAPASTQKIITAAAAYEILGKDFRFQTVFGYSGAVSRGILKGDIVIRGSGDPTLGSWRWKATQEDSVMNRIVHALRKQGIRSYRSIAQDTSGWQGETIPDGWIWQDIGNYYGAGAEALNWRENQFDLLLTSSDKTGTPVMIAGTRPVLKGYQLVSHVRAAAAGTGDNAYIYFPLNGQQGMVRGTIPVSQKQFTISGAFPSVWAQFGGTLADQLRAAGIQRTATPSQPQHRGAGNSTAFHKEQSPVLDTIIYWFLKKSINLYGEALVKSIAAQQQKQATTSQGVQAVREFWKTKGIDPEELHMADGSGLSPLNRVTTHAQVQVLRYARSQDWYAGYYAGLPEFNGMKMKSGTINGAKGFCGYHRSKSGQEFVFSFLVNNYNGSSAVLVQKMYKVLDELK